MNSSSDRDLHPNPILAAGQPLLWLLFAPSVWCAYLHRYAPDLTPFFSLIQLLPAHWRTPALRRLLLLGYGLWPLLVSLGTILWLASVGHLHWVALTGLLYGLGLGLTIGLVIGAAAGIAALTVAIPTYALIWQAPDVMLIDMVLGHGFALVYGLTGAIVAHVIQNLALAVAPPRRLGPGQMMRQLGGFVIALAVSAAIFVLATSGTSQTVTARQSGRLPDQAVSLFFTAAPSLLLGVAAGWRSGRWQHGLRAGLIVLWAALLAFGDTGTQLGVTPPAGEFLAVFGLTTALVWLLFFALPYVLVEGLAGPWAGAVAGALGGLVFFPALPRLFVFFALTQNLVWAAGLTLLGLTAVWWRPLLFFPLQAAWHTILLRRAERGGKPDSDWHPAFWDELQFLPLYGLDDYLALLVEKDRVAGERALTRVSAGRQRWAAQAAQIEIDARRLEGCATVTQIAEWHGQTGMVALGGPASALLRSFDHLSQETAAGLAQTGRYNQRLVLQGVAEALNGLVRELTRSSDAYAARFQPIAESWHACMAAQVQTLTELAEQTGEIANPYIVGVPLTRRQELFVGRIDISAHIEGLLQDRNHPPLLLYGQRRMGKTSLLYNLRWLLPRRIVPLFVDLQGPVAWSKSHDSFLYNIAKAMTTSADEQGLHLDSLTREALLNDPFTVFDDWLDSVERALIAGGRSTILLALDEFEALDQTLRLGILDESAILGGLRHIIQHRPRFKLLLAGSHTLDEFQRWSSYLINAQTIHLRYLRPDEALRLIERPVPDFALVYAPVASRRVLELTRGHP
ncbi:MAG: hypothetical protein M3Q45_00710, partial [Chloroflexota bacterium]|nr:hypothetical protein [Chloroflexota bacterium]